ncbi:peptidyl-prolyl cis-trans isomerase [Altererythrobacter sp. ZODW24]|uniref:peptidyl-prolyl cis-trans isomerase n=1 Tax=Altererythrobacter sp. ZODW24 TaxID=2185142 RepID=UPI000DF78E4C|nr:peptidyl-prolyl cis-trans isomerase [Altererythrobacter sp. ZODW24]
MITFFRSFFQSKYGIGITLAFLALIAFAFASGDVANNATFGGVSGGNRVAVVGDRKIGTAELSRSASDALDQVRQENPTVSMASFLEQGALDDVLDQLIDRAALFVFGEKYGVRAGENLVNSEIIGIGAFQGADGNFSEEVYRGFLAQRRLTDALVREDIGADLMRNQLLVPVALGSVVPDALVTRYASLLAENRDGSIGLLPSGAFAPKGDVTEAQLKTFYDANRGDYIRPERRVVRYATFGDEALGELAAPTAAQIAARYERDKEQYAASQSRRLTQVVVPTEAAANAIRQSASSGGSLDAAASGAGLSATQIGPITRKDLASAASPGAAQAAFDAGRGELSAPARGNLGWYVFRIEAIENKGGRSLAQATGEITTALAAEQRREALLDLSARMEEEIDSGSNIADLAQELKAEVKTTKAVTADGRVYREAGFAPEELAPVLATAFSMEDEGEAQLAEVVPNETFMIFDVSEITASAAAPFADIKDGLEGAYRLAEGSKAAKKAADAIMKRVAGGATLAAAMQAEEVTLPSPETIKMSREQLVASQQQVPPPLALLFSMAEGTVKRLEAPASNGWYVVSLRDIVPGELAADNPMLAQARAQLGGLAGREYSEQMQAAIRKEMGVERNPDAVEAVRKQLSGN